MVVVLAVVLVVSLTVVSLDVVLLVVIVIGGLVRVLLVARDVDDGAVCWLRQRSLGFRFDTALLAGQSAVLVVRCPSSPAGAGCCWILHEVRWGRELEVDGLDLQVR